MSADDPCPSPRGGGQHRLLHGHRLASRPPRCSATVPRLFMHLWNGDVTTGSHGVGTAHRPSSWVTVLSHGILNTCSAAGERRLVSMSCAFQMQCLGF